MKNIVIIKTGIDSKPFLDQVYDNYDDWDWVSSSIPIRLVVTKILTILPLVWAKVGRENPKNVDKQQETPLYSHYSEVRKFLRENNIKRTGRCIL